MALTLVTEEIQKAIGVESSPIRFEVENGWLKRFAEAMDDPNPLWQDGKHASKGRYGTIVAPPTFVAALEDMDWVVKLLDFDVPLKHVVNGGNEIELFQPIRPGDIIEVKTKLIDAKERGGKAGQKLFLTWQATYENQFNDIVAKVTGTIIRY